MGSRLLHAETAACAGKCSKRDSDRPFLFFVQDKETGMILFMGEVRDL